MIKALLLIFEPIATWERIFRAHRGVGFILVMYLLPMLVLTSCAEAYGLVHWGRWRSEIERVKCFPVGETVIFEAAQFALSLAVVFLGAKLIKADPDFGTAAPASGERAAGAPTEET